MTVNGSPQRHTTVAAPRYRLAQRAVLLTGGVVAGFTGSALAGIGLVSLLFPHDDLPGAGVTAVPVPVVAEVARALTPSPVATAPEIRLAAIAPEAGAQEVVPTPEPVHPFDRETRTITRMERDAPTTGAPTPAPDTGAAVLAAQGPATRPVVKGVDAPAAASPATDAATAKFGPRIALMPEPAETGEVRAEDFATLAAVDADARAGAGLFAASPAPVETVDAGGAVPTRPAPRPEPPAELVLAAAALPASTAPMVSPRPQPRPEIRVAAAPAPAPAQAAAPSAAPAELEVATVVSTSSAPRAARVITGGSANCGRRLARAIPSRRGGATGSDFFAGLTNVSGADRDARVISELAKGNIPGFLRDLQPVSFRGPDGRGAQVEITICVTPDYLALGSDKDYVRVPLGLPAAARIAGAFGMTLPTPRMVDAIYAQANVKLSPSPMTPGAQMSSTPYLVTHNATIQQQLGGRRGLIAGQKKDVVMASRMASNPGRVAIYGWHQKSGAPIQPVSTVHGANYADYSHGIRLVSKTAYLNGKPVALSELLASSRYAHLLNDGGPMPGPVIRIASN